MITLRRLPTFDEWFEAIKDRKIKIRLARRLEKAAHGQLGDIKALGEGLFEMREHFGCGWRIYYVQRGREMIILLAGGDKSSQDKDIAKARQLAGLLED